MMNDHESSIIYCDISTTNDNHIITVSQTLEYIEWNLNSGDTVRKFKIEIEEDQKPNASESNFNNYLGKEIVPITAQ